MAHPLGSNDPERYTYYISAVLSEMTTRSIKRYLPAGWSLSPDPTIVPAPPGSPSFAAYLAAVARKKARAQKYDYFDPSRSTLRQQLLQAKMDAHSNDLVRITAGNATNGAPPFTPDDQRLLSTVSGLAKEELAYDKMEIEAIGEYLTYLKTTVNLGLSQIIEKTAEIDRPLYERRPYYVLRTFLFELEPSARCNAKIYIKHLESMFNFIGKADTVQQATFVIEQLLFFRKVFVGYRALHPLARIHEPVEEVYANAIFYRLKDHGALHDAYKILKTALKSDTPIQLEALICEVNDTFLTSRQNIFEPETLPTDHESSASASASSNYRNIQAAHSASQATATQSPIATTVAWQPSPALKKRTYDALTSDPKDLLSMNDEKVMLIKFGN